MEVVGSNPATPTYKNIKFSVFYGEFYDNAHVAKLVDALSSGGSALGCGSSNLLVRTKKEVWIDLFFCAYQPAFILNYF